MNPLIILLQLYFLLQKRYCNWKMKQYRIEFGEVNKGRYIILSSVINQGSSIGISRVKKCTA